MENEPCLQCGDPVLRLRSCSTCNLGLGYFKDNVDNLHEASVYLISERSLLREYGE